MAACGTYGTHPKNWRQHSECFSEMLCGAACAINRKASSENRRFLPKKQKASSKERWVRTHIGFRNAVQLRLWIFRGCICNGKAQQQRKGFRKRTSFLKTHTVVYVPPKQCTCACVYTATKGMLEENMYSCGFTGFPKGSFELGQSYSRFRDACIMRLMTIEC